MALRPYEELVGPLIIPVRGKEYPLPAISMQDGLRIHAATANGTFISIADLETIILGDTKQAMLDDGVPPAVIDRALWAGVADFKAGRDSAEAVWEHGVPKAVMEELGKLAAQALTTPQGEASTTPPQASTSTTKSPAKRAPRSRGSKSSLTSP